MSEKMQSAEKSEMQIFSIVAKGDGQMDIIEKRSLQVAPNAGQMGTDLTTDGL